MHLILMLQNFTKFGYPFPVSIPRLNNCICFFASAFKFDFFLTNHDLQILKLIKELFMLY